MPIGNEAIGAMRTKLYAETFLAVGEVEEDWVTADLGAACIRLLSFW